MKLKPSKNIFIFILLNTLFYSNEVFSAPKKLIIPERAIPKHSGIYKRAYWYEGALRKNNLWFNFLEYDRSFFYNETKSGRISSNLIKVVVIERSLRNSYQLKKDPSQMRIYGYSFLDQYYDCRNRTSATAYTGGSGSYYPPERIIDGYPEKYNYDDKLDSSVGENKPDRKYIKLDNEDHPMWYKYYPGTEHKVEMIPVVRNSNGEAMLEGACRYFK